jgi:alanyl-tRNA synthetase
MSLPLRKCPFHVRGARKKSQRDDETQPHARNSPPLLRRMLEAAKERASSEEHKLAALKLEQSSKEDRLHAELLEKKKELKRYAAKANKAEDTVKDAEKEVEELEEHRTKWKKNGDEDAKKVRSTARSFCGSTHRAPLLLCASLSLSLSLSLTHTHTRMHTCILVLPLSNSLLFSLSLSFPRLKP